MHRFARSAGPRIGISARIDARVRSALALSKTSANPAREEAGWPGRAAVPRERRPRIRGAAALCPGHPRKDQGAEAFDRASAPPIPAVDRMRMAREPGPRPPSGRARVPDRGPDVAVGPRQVGEVVDGDDLAVGPDDRPGVADVGAAAVVAEHDRRRPRSRPVAAEAGADAVGPGPDAVDQRRAGRRRSRSRLGGFPSPVSGSGVERNDHDRPSSCEA